MNDGRIEISIVVPVLNEEDNLAPLDAELREMLSAFGRPAEILYIDDGSRDRSLEIMEGLVRDAAAGPGTIPTRLIKLRRNFGQTAAIAAGFDRAQGEIIVPLDADLQNNPADVPRLVAKLEEGYDAVSGWRRKRNDKAFSRRLPSLVANKLIVWVTNVRIHDFGCTLKAYRASALRQVKLYGDMHRFIPVYLARFGARVTELEVDHRPRTAGESKYGVQRVFRVVLDLVLILFMTRYYTRPMHFFGQAALLFVFLGFLVLGFMVVFKYGWLRMIGIDYQASFVETPLPGLAGTFLSGAISSIFFGILAEILIRIHHESQDQTSYSIENILDSESPCAD